MTATTTAETPIDGERTATQRQRKKPTKPTRGDWSNRPRTNWDEALTYWLAGEGVARISELTGIPPTSIRSHACRHRWPKRNQLDVQRRVMETMPKAIDKHVENAVKEEVGKAAGAIPLILREQIAAHFGRVLKTVGQLHKQVDDVSSKRCEVEEIKSLSSSLETLDRVARRTLGLDSADGAKAASLVASSVTRVDCPIVEADVVSEAPGTQLQ